jgi:hypothetical protein
MNSDHILFISHMNDILTHLIFYTSVVGVSILVAGNIFNILICLRKRIRKEMMGYYNIVISMWNILTFGVGLCFYFPPAVYIQDFLLASNFLCATLNYTLRVCVLMSAWLHVCLTIDRYLCVAFHQKLNFLLKSKKKLSYGLVGLFIFICAINVPNLFFTLEITKSNTSSSTTEPKIQCDSTPLINQIRNIFISIFRIFLPLVLQIVFSILLIYKLFKVRRTVMANQSMDKEYKFARIILWLNLMFLITETPFLTTTLYFSVIKEIPKYPIDSSATNIVALMTVIYYATLIFSLYLFGSLFFVNLFTNKLFQREIQIIFGF